MSLYFPSLCYFVLRNWVYSLLRLLSSFVRSPSLTVAVAVTLLLHSPSLFICVHRRCSPSPLRSPPSPPLPSPWRYCSQWFVFAHVWLGHSLNWVFHFVHYVDECCLGQTLTECCLWAHCWNKISYIVENDFLLFFGVWFWDLQILCKLAKMT